MNEAKPAHIKISGRLAFEDDITLSQAAQIVAFLDLTPGAASPPTFVPTQARLAAAAPTSANPRDALDASGAKTNPEKLVAFALHVLQDGSKDTFTLEDVRPLFRRARETAPGNITRDLDSAIKAGWLAESDTKGEFYVTDKAGRVLTDGFEAIRGNRGGVGKTRPAAKKARKSTTEVPEVFKGIDLISPTLDGVVGYHKLKTNTDKFLWAVYAAKVMGIDSVTNKDLVWLTDKLGHGISSGDIAANFRSNHKNGYLNRSTQDQKIRTTPAGEAYLKAKTEPKG